MQAQVSATPNAVPSSPPAPRARPADTQSLLTPPSAAPVLPPPALVAPGDVGFVRDGRFWRLFNVRLPQDHPSHRALGVPPDFAPFHDPDASLQVPPASFDALALHPGKPLVPLAQPRPGAAPKDGEIVILQQPLRADSMREDDGEPLLDYVHRYLPSWLAHLRSLGHDPALLDDALVLVRGTYRAPPPFVARGARVPLPAAPRPALAKRPASPAGSWDSGSSASGSDSELDDLTPGADCPPAVKSVTTATATVSVSTVANVTAPGSSSSPASSSEAMTAAAAAVTAVDAAMAKPVVTTGPVAEASARRRMHAAKFVCEICGTALTTKRNLEGHLNAHLGKKEYKCAHCNEWFTRTWDRKRHEKRMHAHLLGSSGSSATASSSSFSVGTGSTSGTVSSQAYAPPLGVPVRRVWASPEQMDEPPPQTPSRDAGHRPYAHAHPDLAPKVEEDMLEESASTAPGVRTLRSPERPNSTWTTIATTPPPPSDRSQGSRPAPQSQPTLSPSISVAKPIVTTAPVADASNRRRTREAKFVCEICGRALTTKTNLEGHRNAHLGKKEHKCSICNEPFAREWDRKRHEKRTHSRGSGQSHSLLTPAAGAPPYSANVGVFRLVKDAKVPPTNVTDVS